jgi:Ca2+-binding EF-hand superfamily protein
MIHRFTNLWLFGGLSVAAALLLPQFALGAEDEKKPDGPNPEALFKQLDKNNDGQLTEDEIPDEQQRLFKRLVRNADKDSDGKLSQAEFAEGLKNDRPRRPLEQPANPALAGGQGGGAEADAIFKRLDANNDGKVTLDEVPEEAKDKFKGALERGDTDKDGVLTLAEFRAVMGQTPANPNAPGTPPGSKPGAPQASAEAMFKYLDANNDGTVTPEEVPEPRREGFKKALEQLDTGKKGGLNLEEFRKLFAMLNPQAAGTPGQPGTAGARPGLDAMFKQMDKNGDGKVTPEEVAEERREGFQRILERGDTDKDGALSKEEFTKAMGAMAAGRPGAAGTPPQGRPEVGQILKRMLEERDTNKDGKLSKDEVGDRMKENFEKIDANSDGFLDEAEITKMLSQFGPNRPGAGNPEGRKRPDGDNKPKE